MKKKGFTIIEVTLAMAFISVMLLSLAVIIYSVTNIYHKGIAMRAINSVGRELVDDFSRTISASPSIPLTTYCGNYTGTAYNECVNDNARLYIYHQQYGTVKINGTVKEVPTYGVFCTGRHSYIWNTGYVLNRESFAPIGSVPAATLKYTNSTTGTTDTLENFRLIKVTDTSRELCSQHLINRVGGGTNVYALTANQSTFDATGIGVTEAHIDELLEHSEEDLALYDLTIFRPTQHGVTLHSFYSGTFILSTLGGTVDITGAGDYCTEAPDGLATDFNYCAINKFNFAMRAEGQLKTGE